MSANTLGEYLQNHNYVKDSKETITHTKIGDKSSNIYGASYTMYNNDEFLSCYFKQLKLGGEFYLTEKQLESDGRMLVVDLDFRYNPEVKTRQHTNDTLLDIVNAYAEKINEIYNFPDNSEIKAFVMEKPNVNCLEDKTKDGIHMIFTLKMRTEEQTLLRRKLINNCDVLKGLPLTNSLEDVYDEGITKGTTNWQLYGSRKPKHEAYKIAKVYDILFNTKMEDYEVKENTTLLLKNKYYIINIEENYKLLSVRYENHPKFELNNNEFLLEALENEKERLKPKEKKMIVEAPKDESTMDYNEKIINLIKPETLGKYAEWRQIISAMKNEGLTEEFARTTSNRATGTFTELTEDAWEKYWNAETKFKMGTLKMYAKRDSPEEYEELTFKIFEPDKNESFVKDINSATDSYFSGLYAFLKPNNTLYIKDDDAYYTWIENTWVKESKDGASYIRTDIEKTLKTYQTHLLFKYIQKRDEAINEVSSRGLAFEDEKTEMEMIKNKYDKILSSLKNRIHLIETTCRKNNIWTELKSIYLRESLKHNIKFDMNPDVIGFNNKKYNFKTKEFQPIKIDDYISMTCGYDYKEPEEDEMETIKDIITKAFPNEERRKCYVSIMYNCLIGGAKDKFVVANGTGGNSKGLIHELLRLLLGDYAVEMGTSVLTEKPRTGANPELAKLDKKRLILSKEPNENDKIRCDMLKKVCGNSKITDARECYSNKTEIVLCGTNIMEVNVKLGFDGKIQDDIGRRLMDILFESTFTDDPEIYNDKTRKNVFMQNKTYTTEEFKNKHRCALFKYLIENAETTIYTPDCVKNDTKKYMEDNDNVHNWVMENYELTTNTEDVVKLKDMYEEYKKSDEYQNAYKKDRKTLKTFSVEIMTHKRLKSKYVEVLQDKFLESKYNCKKMRSVLIGVKSIKDEQECYIYNTD